MVSRLAALDMGPNAAPATFAVPFEFMPDHGLCRSGIKWGFRLSTSALVGEYRLGLTILTVSATDSNLRCGWI